MSNYICYKGLDKAEILYNLYKCSNPKGLGFFSVLNGEPFTQEKAREILQYKTSFDYIDGRPVKVDLSSDDGFDATLYNRDNGENAAQEALKGIITEAKIKYRKAQEEKNNYIFDGKSVVIDYLDVGSSLEECIKNLEEINKLYENGEHLDRGTIRLMLDAVNKRSFEFDKFSGLNTISSLFSSIQNIVSHPEIFATINESMKGRSYKEYYQMRENLLKFAKNNAQCPDNLVKKFEKATNTFGIEDNYNKEQSSNEQ